MDDIKNYDEHQLEKEYRVVFGWTGFVVLWHHGRAIRYHVAHNP
jgi:hypothetical protein